MPKRSTSPESSGSLPTPRPELMLVTIKHRLAKAITGPERRVENRAEGFADIRYVDMPAPAVPEAVARGNVDFSNDFSFFLHGAHVVVGFWQMRLRGQGIEGRLMRTMLAERRTPVLRGAWVRSGRFRAESVCGAADTVKRQVFGVPENRTSFSSDAWHDWCENCGNKLE